MGVAHQVIYWISDGPLVERRQGVRFGVEPGVQRLVQASRFNSLFRAESVPVGPHRLHGEQATEVSVVGSVGVGPLDDPVGANRPPLPEALGVVVGPLSGDVVVERNVGGAGGRRLVDDDQVPAVEGAELYAIVGARPFGIYAEVGVVAVLGDVEVRRRGPVVVGDGERRVPVTERRLRFEQQGDGAVVHVLQDGPDRVADVVVYPVELPNGHCSAPGSTTTPAPGTAPAGPGRGRTSAN